MCRATLKEDYPKFQKVIKFINLNSFLRFKFKSKYIINIKYQKLKFLKSLKNIITFKILNFLKNYFFKKIKGGILKNVNNVMIQIYLFLHLLLDFKGDINLIGKTGILKNVNNVNSNLPLIPIYALLVESNELILH